MRVLVCSLDSLGFLYPAIGLAVALRGRGHEVAFVTNRSAAGLLVRQSFERIPCGERDGRSFETAHWFRPLAVALQVKHIEFAMARFSPEVVVGQALTLGPLVVRERRGVPVVLQGLATYLWPGVGERQPGAAATDERRTWRRRDMLGHLNAARVLVGLAAHDEAGDEGPLLGDQYWLRSVVELDGGAALPSSVERVGACLWEPEEEDEALSDWLAEMEEEGRAVIYAQPGRSFGGPGFWGPMVEGLAAGSAGIAVATGRMDAEAGAPQEKPAGWFVREHFHQGAVLRRADLMIGSATTTAVLGALSHGVPSVLIPGGGEQHELAEQVERAGAGRVLAADGLTAGELRRVVGAALEDAEMRRRAGELRVAFGQIDGFGKSARMLEQLVAAAGGGAVGAGG